MKIDEPCPFCGERRDLQPVELAVLPAGDEPRAYASDFFVGCAKCGSLGPPAASETEAVEKWNKRSNQADRTEHHPEHRVNER